MLTDKQSREFDRALTAIALLRAVVFLCLVGAIPLMIGVGESQSEALGVALFFVVLLSAVLFKAAAAALGLLRLIAMTNIEQAATLRSQSPSAAGTTTPAATEELTSPVHPHEVTSVPPTGVFPCPLCAGQLYVDPKSRRPQVITCSACGTRIRVKESSPGP